MLGGLRVGRPAVRRGKPTELVADPQRHQADSKTRDQSGNVLPDSRKARALVRGRIGCGGDGGHGAGGRLGKGRWPAVAQGLRVSRKMRANENGRSDIPESTLFQGLEQTDADPGLARHVLERESPSEPFQPEILRPFLHSNCPKALHRAPLRGCPKSSGTYFRLFQTTKSPKQSLRGLRALRGKKRSLVFGRLLSCRIRARSMSVESISPAVSSGWHKGNRCRS